MTDNPYPPIVGTPEPSPADRLLACADLLACPQCAGPLAAPAPGTPRALHCPRGHTFDLAKQGYVSLLTGASTKMTGDTPAMLDARAAFQSAGHFTPIAEALATAVATALDRDTPVFGADSPSADSALEHPPATARVTADPIPSNPDDTARSGPAIPARSRRFGIAVTAPGKSVTAASAARLAATLRPGATAPTDGHRSVPAARYGGPRRVADAVVGPTVLEIGAGTGYYLGAVLDAAPQARGIALDVSKAAARRAARAHGRAGSVLADAWRGLPVPDGVMSAVVCVFAPRNADEVARVLAGNGRFIVVTPTSRHLGELIGPLGMVSVDAAKQDRLAEALGERFEQVSSAAVEYTMRLSHEDVTNVVAMGPSAFHAAEQRVEGIAALPDPMPVTASVTVSVYRAR